MILSSRALLRRRLARGLLNLAAGAITLLPTTTADAQTDEIQVYDAEINNPGVFSLQLHNNYTPIGREAARIRGRHRAEPHLNGVPEWALGVTDWLELGAYAPVYSWTGDGRFLIDGAKLRAEFVVPHAAERSFFYGVNLELGFNARYWEPTRTSGEIRPIIGGRLGPVDLIVNPILDTSFQGLGSLDFAPASRVAYNFSETWAAALEHYADYGRLNHLEPLGRQQQLLFAVVDYKSDSAERRIWDRPRRHGGFRPSGAQADPVARFLRPARPSQSKTMTPRATSPASISAKPSLISSNR